MKNEPTPHHNPVAPAAPVKHQYEHATPTVIHDPEEDMMLLARWVHRAMKDPARFWGWVLGICAAVLGLVVVANLLTSGGSSTSNLWTDVEAARSADDLTQIATNNPRSPVAPWALLQAASRLYESGINDLPGNTDPALQSLKKAIDLFDQIGRTEPKTSPVALAAAFGKARALEARNELPKAVDQYKLVADTWPDSPEAAEAKKLAASLQKPEAATFYKDLYAFKKPVVALPPLGSQSLDFPVNPAPANSILPTVPLIPPPTSSPSPAAETAPAAATPAADAPKTETAPAATPAEAPKTDAPKP
ncbi:tetratricopeptide repeat protein [Paludisphaera rhizosphaerae]|uniref:tetratricopeptide repeat protein n=1 Tax=Paludisphaera rhizosphaerae TaxID=2711216 RepID=UPI0013ECF7AE|nr:tetratricopeptide repeat protein [Paludisphaera rhizosphaerae]